MTGLSAVGGTTTPADDIKPHSGLQVYPMARLYIVCRSRQRRTDAWLCFAADRRRLLIVSPLFRGVTGRRWGRHVADRPRE